MAPTRVVTIHVHGRSRLRAAVLATAVALTAAALSPAPGEVVADPVVLAAGPEVALVSEQVPAGSRGRERSAVPVVAAVVQTPSATPSTPAVAVADRAVVLGSRAASLEVPSRVLAAYRSAADRTAHEDPSCGLPWWLLAAIGMVESGHAAGGLVDDAGLTSTKIFGPRLDGTLPGTKVVPDSDGGGLDDDDRTDRAVGPMQFLPGTWRGWGADADGDGVANPHDVDDAVLSAARYLCAGNAEVSTARGMTAAVLRYNHSQAYVRRVLQWGHGYRDGVLPVAGATAAAASVAKPRTVTTTATTTTTATATATTTATATATATVTSTVTVTATVTVTETATATATVTVTGPLTTTTSPTSAPPTTTGTTATTAPTGTETATTATAVASATAEGTSTATEKAVTEP